MTIWLATNETRFNNSKPCVHVVLGKILAYTKINSSFSKVWVAYLLIEHVILDNLHVEKRYSNAPKIIIVFWTKPNILWVKFNTDGSVRGKIAAGGVITRGNHGKL